MKVRCNEIADAFGSPAEKSPWITVGKTYHVLSIEFSSPQVLFRLKGDRDNGVALFGSSHFEIISEVIPSSWVVTGYKRGSFSIGPQAWSAPTYWEEYYEYDDVAVRIFDTEFQKIIEADQ